MESRPQELPKLQDYQPSRFMLPTSHYDKAKADRAVRFIEQLRHTKGIWAGKRFWLLPWQERLIRDLFGIVQEDGMRQFRMAYIEIPKKNGKSELAAAIALYLLFGDGEPSAEVYGAAADRQQASIVYEVATKMIQMCPALQKRCKQIPSTKRVVNYANAGFYTRLYCKIYNFAIPAMHCRWWLCHQEPPFILSSQSRWLCSRFSQHCKQHRCLQ